MKITKKLFTFLFIICLGFTLNAQQSKKELRSKKTISKYIIKAKSIENRDKKEEVFEKLVSKFNKQYEKADITLLAAEDKESLKKIHSNINNAWAQTKGKNHEALNNFGNYFESEYNQANPYLLGVGLALFAILLGWLIGLVIY